MRPVQFTILDQPVAWQRAGLGRGGRHFTRPETREWEELVGWYGRQAMAGRELLTGPVELLVVFQLPIPASWPQWKRALAAEGKVACTAKPDWDNLGKGVSDALNGVVWADDAQVVDAFTRKRYGDPCAIVYVKPLDLLPAQVSRRPTREEGAR